VFTDTSTNTPTSWSWDFGDGESSSDQNPSHIYQNPGDYAVSLSAANAAGKNSTTVLVTISAVPVTALATLPVVVPTTRKETLPEISFSGTPVSGSAPLTVAFSAKTPDSPEEFSWDFGDGGTSSEEFPSYTYVIPGTYTVTLTVKYPEGKKTSVQTNYITVDAPAAGSPLPPATPIVAIVAGACLSLVYSGRKRA